MGLSQIGWLGEELKWTHADALAMKNNSEISNRLTLLVRKYVDRFGQDPPTPEIWRELYIKAWDGICENSKKNSLPNSP